MLIKKIDRFTPVSASSLCKSLAWIAADKEVCMREVIEVRDIAAFNLCAGNVVSVGQACRLPNIVGPNYVEARLREGEV
jgi:hypothetical protein